MPTRKVLIFGASYGSLLGMKLALAGHHAQMVCLPQEADLINARGAVVRTPIKGRQGLLEISSRDLPGKVTASIPEETDVAGFDLVALAMQEPQYRAAGVRELLDKVARAGLPCMSIMNMPPLPYLARIPGIDIAKCTDSYTDPAVWRRFDPKLVTLCSPDPQAFRPPDQPANVLQVRLATNFKAARFDSNTHTALLQDIAMDIEAARFERDGERLALPVKLRVHDSSFVPLAKWAMLLAGNYRCVEAGSMRSIRDAVHSDPAASRDIYSWVVDLCVSLGASPRDMVPFEKYAQAALSLESPSSAARALAGGAQHIERVDRLVQGIAQQRGLRSDTLDEIVSCVDLWLVRNRRKG